MGVTVNPVIVGYCHEHSESGEVKACGSVTLIIDGAEKILVDCGGPSEKDLLIEELSQNCLAPEDIVILVCTHGHLDHVGNLNLFQSAQIFLSDDVGFPSSRYRSSSLRAEELLQLTPNVSLMKTIGHTNHDISVVVKNPLDQTTTVVAGDIFEREGDDIANSWAVMSWDANVQKRSRQRILSVADFIVPGHGAMFAVNAESRRKHCK